MVKDPISKFLRQQYPYTGQALEDRLLDRSALAERWSCSIETVRRLERQVLKPIQIGGRIKFRLSDILRSEREGELS
jgi:hypothetical protein